MQKLLPTALSKDLCNFWNVISFMRFWKFQRKNSVLSLQKSKSIFTVTQESSFTTLKNLKIHLNVGFFKNFVYIYCFKKVSPLYYLEILSFTFFGKKLFSLILHKIYFYSLLNNPQRSLKWCLNAARPYKIISIKRLIYNMPTNWYVVFGMFYAHNTMSLGKTFFFFDFWFD